MRILVTNISVSGRSGTELVTAEVALRLQGAGDTVAVYTPLKGPTAQVLTPRGIVVADRIRDLEGFDPHLIHGQHNAPFLVARAAFARAPAVWSCHDYRSHWDRPPPPGSAQLFIAHSAETAERIRREGGIGEDRIRMLPNAADLGNVVAPAVPPAARSVLIVGKGDQAGALPDLAHVLRAQGFAVTCVGRGIGPVVSNLPEVMAAHAVVVSSDRTALEAMAAGCAVVCADARGLAGLVTPENFHTLRRRNFGGAALARPLDPAAVVAEIAAIDPATQAALRRVAMPEIGLDLYMDRLRAIHAEAIALAGSPAPGDAMRGAETLEAMLASPRPGGFGPEATRRMQAEHATRLARAEREAARLALRLRLATLKPGERLHINDWHRGPGAALLGAGWTRAEEGRVAMAGGATIDLTEAFAQRRLAAVTLQLAPTGAAGAARLEVLDGARPIASVTAEAGIAAIELPGAALLAAGAKSVLLRAVEGSGRGWTLMEAALLTDAPA
ncbi:glycosyltransferase [Roseomonas sp. HF4]|uniref:glycosyltransferase n=1 Tax=Roseomonas sp. HF4 TaxID=2562313 RepID=UPI0010BFA1D9|nr:glycosyltransferase [Roseomonas sp. HF4]